MPPPAPRADGSPAVVRPGSPLMSTSSSNARGGAIATPSGSKRIKLNRPTDDHPSDAHLQSSSSSSPTFSSRHDHEGLSGSNVEIGLSTSSLRSRSNAGGGSMTDHGNSTSRGHDESRRDSRRGEPSRSRDHGMGTGSNRLTTGHGGGGGGGGGGGRGMSSNAPTERSGGGGGGGGGRRSSKRR
ncbi:hypothetical protein K457DRAFT_643043 [Linnemannia elongata AG-77]|uniref:Uncharacterized protein n=1 Tax=Linnemannia elongata AG-77 TaxID=1314771 RepID=A0A197JPR4_9FUNG|nr:hypothetical protein K457DRAFT_643043 [Linnemannia elongata AG-77]